MSSFLAVAMLDDAVAVLLLLFCLKSLRVYEAIFYKDVVFYAHLFDFTIFNMLILKCI